MEADAGLSGALAALIDAADERASIVATPAVVASGRLVAAGIEVLPLRELVRRLHEGPAAAVVAVDGITPTLLRALREAPPALLIVTDVIDEESVAALSRIGGMALLGPHARLHVGDGARIVCADEDTELAALIRALGGEAPRLAIAPTPAWLPVWLANPALRGAQVIGMIPERSLTSAWATWSRGLAVEAAARHVLVPLGVDAPRIEAPRHRSLEVAMTAHTLERMTGPIFPAAPVLAAIARGLERAPGAPSTASVARWQQARRALPRIGAMPAMEQPHPGLALDDPGAAFLAQRALLRRARAEELLAGPRPPPPRVDDTRVERSLEVLRSAGEILSEHESKVVLRGFDIEVTRQAVASSASGAASFAETIGFPVVLKAVSPDLRRKQEVGAVILDLTTSAAVRRAYATIVSNVEERAPTAHLDGVLVAEQIEPGLEIHCGMVRMASGALVHYGRALAPGWASEFVLAAAPLDPAEALLLADAVLSRAPAPALRRRTDPDAQVLAELFLRLDRLREESEDRLLAVDLNPLRLIGGERGYVTLDARISQRAHLEGL